jgi:hypothetical protein
MYSYIIAYLEALKAVPRAWKAVPSAFHNWIGALRIVGPYWVSPCFARQVPMNDLSTCRVAFHAA